MMSLELLRGLELGLFQIVAIEIGSAQGLGGMLWMWAMGPNVGAPRGPTRAEPVIIFNV